MRDLRPKYARDIQDAVVTLLQEHGILVPSELLPAMQEAIVGCLTHKRVPMNGSMVGTDDEAAITAFMEKYPEIHPALEKGQAEILERWPSAEFTVRLWDDPEDGSILRETQYLLCEVDIENEIEDDEGEDPLWEQLDDWIDEWGDDNDALYDVFRFVPVM